MPISKLLEKVNSGLNLIFEQTSEVVTWSGDVGWSGGGIYDQRNYIYTPQLTKSGNYINGRNALAISAFYDGVRMIAEDIGKLKLEIFTKDAQDNNIKVNRDHDLYRVLSMSPDGVHTSQQFWETLIAWTLVWGNGYAYIDRDVRGTVRSLQLIHPNRVTIEKNNGIVTYIVSLDQEEDRKTRQNVQRYPSQEIFRLRGVGDEDGSWGIANFARESLGITLATQTLQSNLFSNGINLGGVLQTDAVMEKTHRDQMAKEWQMTYGGVNNFGKVAVIDAGLQYVPNTALKSTDAELLETRKFQVEEVARWLRIPLHKLGILESNATFNNIDQENIKYNTETLGAWMQRIKSEIEMKLMLFDPLFFVEYDLKPLTMTDPQSLAKYWNDLIDSGIATPNDAASDLGFKTYSAGEQHYITNNVQPVERMAMETELKQKEMELLVAEDSTGGEVLEGGMTQEQLDFETLKSKFDSYGVGVRAGALTPQTVDEDSFRDEAGLPPMGQDVRKAWEGDGGVRRPITLKSQDEYEAESEKNEEVAETEVPEPPAETETEETEAEETALAQLDPMADILGRYQKLMIRPLQMVVNREIAEEQRREKIISKMGDKFDAEKDAESQQNFKLKIALNYDAVLEPFLEDMDMEMPAGFIAKWIDYQDAEWHSEKAMFIANDLIKHYLQINNLPAGLYNFEKPNGETCFVSIDAKGVISELQN